MPLSQANPCNCDLVWVQAGLEPIVRQIYLKAEGFGANLDLNYRSNEVAEVSLEPREFAEQYTNQVEPIQ